MFSQESHDEAKRIADMRRKWIGSMVVVLFGAVGIISTGVVLRSAINYADLMWDIVITAIFIVIFLVIFDKILKYTANNSEGD
jgi:hypothetical protein